MDFFLFWTITLSTHKTHTQNVMLFEEHDKSNGWRHNATRIKILVYQKITNNITEQSDFKKGGKVKHMWCWRITSPFFLSSEFLKISTQKDLPKYLHRCGQGLNIHTPLYYTCMLFELKGYMQVNSITGYNHIPNECKTKLISAAAIHLLLIKLITGICSIWVL